MYRTNRNLHLFGLVLSLIGHILNLFLLYGLSGSGYSLTNIEKYNEPDKLKDSDALSDWLFN